MTKYQAIVAIIFITLVLFGLAAFTAYAKSAGIEFTQFTELLSGNTRTVQRFYDAETGVTCYTVLATGISCVNTEPVATTSQPIKLKLAPPIVSAN